MSKLKTWQITVIALLGLCSFCGVCFTGMAVLDYMGLLSTDVPELVSLATDLQIATTLPYKLQPTRTPTLLPTVTEVPTNSPVPIPTEVIITLTRVPQGPSYSGPAACIPQRVWPG